MIILVTVKKPDSYRNANIRCIAGPGGLRRLERGNGQARASPAVPV